MVVSYRNSTSNHNRVLNSLTKHSVVSYRNSTSNHNFKSASESVASVVSYRNSTSNHNRAGAKALRGPVVSYRNSTSNHNQAREVIESLRLYLIEILHQTTTRPFAYSHPICCILSKFYIKPQRRCRRALRNLRCILSKFYIKPQRWGVVKRIVIVVSYRNSTSNHNYKTTTN